MGRLIVNLLVYIGFVVCAIGLALAIMHWSCGLAC